MFSHAIPCQGGVTRAERKGGGSGVGVVHWDGCDQAGDEGIRVGAKGGGRCLDWTHVK